MSYQDIRNTREGFVDSGAGDRIIRIESKIVAIVAFVLMLTYFEKGIIPALIAGVVVGFVFPWLVGLIEFFAWVATIVFSVIWAIIGYFLGGAVGGVAVGVIVAIIIFIVSFFLHKVFAGLGYSSVTKHALDALDETRDNTAQTRDSVNTFQNNVESNVNNIKYCPNCGTALDKDARFCTNCGKTQ